MYNLVLHFRGLGMKTATIQIYPLFQAKGWAGRVCYRGKCLHESIDADKPEIIRYAEKYAKDNGFTRAKFYEENHWGKIYFYEVTLKD